MASATACPLLALPAELQNAIYELVFSDSFVELPTPGKRPTIRDCDLGLHKKASRAFALVRTCRQIYSEYLTMFYSSTTFYASSKHIALAFLTNMQIECRQNLKELRYDTAGMLASPWELVRGNCDSSYTSTDGQAEQRCLDSLVRSLEKAGMQVRVGLIRVAMYGSSIVWTAEPEKDSRFRAGLHKWGQRPMMLFRRPLPLSDLERLFYEEDESE